MKDIKFTLAEYGHRFESPLSGKASLELCRRVLNDVLKLPSECKQFFVVPLKTATVDTVKIEVSDHDFYLLVDGERTEFEWSTADFIRVELLAKGYSNFRIEF